MGRLKRLYNIVNLWCGRNPLAVLIIGVIIALSGYTFHSIVSADFSGIKNILLFKLQFPLYSVLIFLFTAFLAFMLVRRTYIFASSSTKILVGLWKNEWAPGTPGGGSEHLEITKDLKYYVNGIHYFDIVDITYLKEDRVIEFSKLAVRADDNRRVRNVLTIRSNNVLEGTENGYPIRYTKVTRENSTAK